MTNSNLTSFTGHSHESSACCGHLHWWRHLSNSSATAARKPFALPGTAKQYAPDLTAHVHHTKLVIAVDPVAKTLVGNCLTTIEPIYENQPISTIFFEATDLHIDSVRVHGESETLKFDIMDKGILVHLAKVLNKGEQLVIDIKYNTLSPKLGIYFTGPTSLYPSKPYQVWTQSQDDDAHHWFPVAEADHPNHRMTSEVVATVPNGFTALSTVAC